MTRRARPWIQAPGACVAIIAMTAGLASAGTLDQQRRERSDQAAGGTLLAGVVLTDEQVPQPQHAAVVTLSGDGDASTVTDDDGRFEFHDLVPGRYTLTVTKTAWVTTAFGATRPDGPGTPITLAGGQVMADIVVRVPRGAVITGVILTPEGNPVPNLPVSVLPGFAAEAVLTDDRGEYRIWGLAPGDYVVMASPPSGAPGGAPIPSSADVDARLAELERTRGIQAGRPLPAPARTSAATTGTVSYTQVYYPGTASQSQAVPLQVAAGEERRGVDFVLLLSGTSTIAGDVRYPDGTPVVPDELGGLNGPVLTVSALPRDVAAQPPLGVRPQTVLNRTDGRFTIVNVAPGRYRVRARLLGAVGPAAERGPTAGPPTRATRLWADQELDVAAAGVSGVTLTLRPAMSITGHVVFDGKTRQAPSDEPRVRVTLVAADGDRGGVAPPAVADMQPDGRFEISGILPGTYRLSVDVPGVAGWSVRSAMLDGIDLLDHPPELGADRGDLRNVIVTLTDRVTELAGTFRRSTGVPAPEHYIVAIPADRTLWQPGSRSLVFTRPATDGYFVFRNLPSGVYFVAALTEFDPGTWRRPGFLEEVAATGVRVTVLEGERVVQDLQMAD